MSESRINPVSWAQVAPDAPIRAAWNAKQCRAKSKRTHLRCRAAAMKGRAVCYHHGGKAGAPKGNQNALKTGLHTAIMVTIRKAVSQLRRSARGALDEF